MLSELTFGFGRRLPVILQTEAAECGLACVAMIASFHGQRTDLSSIRRKYPISLRGTTFSHLIHIADALQMSSRPLRVDLRDLSRLRLPCILHWDMNHFVVLRKVGTNSVLLHDPACGEVRIGHQELRNRCTGAALELWPAPGFQPKKEPPAVRISNLLGHSTGLYRTLLQLLLIALSMEAFALVSPLLIQWVVDESLVSADRELLTTLVLGFGLLTLIQTLISTARSWVIMFMGTTLNVQWSTNVLGHLLQLPIQYFQKRHLGDVFSRFGSIRQIQNTITTSFVTGILDGIMAASILAMMFVYSAQLSMIVVATMIVYVACRIASFRMLSLATNSQIVFAAKQDSHFLESIRAVKTIKLFQREELRRSTWSNLMVDQVNAGLRTQKITIISGSINQLLVGTETLLVVWIGGSMVLDGEFSVGMLLAFKAYKDLFDGRLSSLIDRLVQFRLLKLHGVRLADIVLSETERRTSPIEDQSTGDRATRIVVKDLVFRYGALEPIVLNRINLSIEEGESVAIVGPSGCGKSTLMHVMLGVLEPVMGDVMIGELSTRQLGPGSLRKIVGSVAQDDALLAGSIADNISFFDPEANQQWIEECARLAAIHDEITSMPMGYNSLVGDMGTVLSGGQKQRVLLARALYKKPRILFLDEATSHLDVAKEREVNDSLQSLNVTKIFIAHRPETIATAGRVLRMMNGAIVEDSRDSAASRSVGGVTVPRSQRLLSEESGSALPEQLAMAPACLRI